MEQLSVTQQYLQQLEQKYNEGTMTARAWYNHVQMASTKPQSEQDFRQVCLHERKTIRALLAVIN